MSKKSNSAFHKKSLAAISGVSVAAILLSSGTVALWKDTVNLNGEQIISGNLDVEKLGDLKWFDISSDVPNAPKPVTLENLKTVPGDIIEGKQDLDVALEGDNLLAKLKIESTGALGELVSEQDGLNIQYRIVDADGEAYNEWVSLNSPETILNLKPSMMKNSILDNVKDFTVEIKVSFDKNTPLQVRTKTLADLGTLSATLQQLRASEVDAKNTMTLHKTATIIGDNKNVGTVNWGEKIRYSYTVTNTSFETINNITIVDPLLSDKNLTLTPASPQTIEPNRSKTFTVEYTPTPEDLLSPSNLNTGAYAQTGTTTSNTSTTNIKTSPLINKIVLTSTAKIAEDKYTVGTVDPGDVIEYSFNVTNTGEATLKNVKITDPYLTGIKNLTIPTIEQLTPGETKTVKITFTPTLEDIKTGSITVTPQAESSATVCITGECVIKTAAEKLVLTTQPLSNDLKIDATQKLTVDNNSDGKLGVGDTIQYDFTVTNQGTVDVENINVSSNYLANMNVNLTSKTSQARTTKTATNTVTPGETKTFTATYTPTAEQLADGNFTVDLTAEATPTVCYDENCAIQKTATFLTTVVEPTNSAQIVENKAEITTDNFNKRIVDPTDVITYFIKVKNTGNTDLNNPTISDPYLNNKKVSYTSSNTGALKPGEIRTYTAVLTPQYSDLTGSIIVTPTFNATGTKNTTVTSKDDSIILPTHPAQTLSTINAEATITEDKLNTNQVDPGDEITYTVLVTNTGNVPMKNINLSDNYLDTRNIKFTSAQTGDLQPGETRAYIAVYKPDNKDLGSIIKVVVKLTATGDNNENITVNASPINIQSNAAVSTTNLTTNTSLTIDNYDNSKVDAGDTIKYVTTVTNTGNLPMTNIVISNNKLLTQNSYFTTDNNDEPLQPGESRTYTATYNPTVADLSTGSFVMTPQINYTADNKQYNVNGSTSTIQTVPVTNNLTITNPTQKLLVDIKNDGKLGVNDSIQFAWTVTNNGTVETSAPNITSTYLNTKNVTINSGTNNPLQPGETRTYTAIYNPTPEGLSNGDIKIDSAATSTPKYCAAGTNCTANIAPATTLTITPTAPTNKATIISTTAEITSDNFVKGKVDPTDIITYTVTVRNDGDVTLNNPTMNSNLSAKGVTFTSDETTPLQPGETRTYTAYYSPTNADLGGTISMTPTFNATGVKNAPVNAAGSTTILQSNQVDSGLNIDAKLSYDIDNYTKNVADPGDKLTYTVTVTNTGNVPGDSLNLADAYLNSRNITFITAQTGPLNPGQSRIYTATYTPTVTDLNTTNITVTPKVTYTTNQTQATLSGNTISTPTRKLENKITVTPTQTLTIDNKTDGVLGLNDTVTYNFALTNNGTVDITNPKLSSTFLTGKNVTITGTNQTIKPGETVNYQATYTPTPQQLLNGNLNVDITATADPTVCTSGTTCPVTASNNITTTVSAPSGTAAITSNTYNFTKDILPYARLDASDEVQYLLIVKNTGEVPMTNNNVTNTYLNNRNVTYTSAQTGDIMPGESRTYTATYTPSTADLDNTSPELNIGTSTVNYLSIGRNLNVSTSNSNITKVAPNGTYTMSTYSTSGSTIKSGDVVTVVSTFTNTGNTTMKNVNITTPTGMTLYTGSTNSANLPAGQSLTATFRKTENYNSNQLLTFTYSNTVTAVPDMCAQGSYCNARTWSDSKTMNAAPNPKVESTTSISSVNGDGTTTLNTTVNNTGNVPATVTVSSTGGDGTSTSSPTTINPGGSQVITTRPKSGDSSFTTTVTVFVPTYDSNGNPTGITAPAPTTSTPPVAVIAAIPSCSYNRQGSFPVTGTCQIPLNATKQSLGNNYTKGQSLNYSLYTKSGQRFNYYFGSTKVVYGTVYPDQKTTSGSVNIPVNDTYYLWAFYNTANADEVMYAKRL